MSCCTAKQTTKHIATTFVRWQDTIRCHKCNRTDMVSDNTDADVCICVFFVCNTCHLADLVTKCLDRIYIKDRIYVLYDNCQTLESHTCINILLLKLCIVVVSIVIKLGKYVVPYFHITVTVTTDCTTRLAAAILFSTVIINL